MDTEPTIEWIYAEINRKRAILWITPDMFSTATKRVNVRSKSDRKLMISSTGGCMFI